MKITPSRNIREGNYAGHLSGGHMRIHKKIIISLSSWNRKIHTTMIQLLIEKYLRGKHK